jgi:hypothetical protein
VTNTEQFTQNIATLVKGITQGTTTRGIEMGQGSGNIGEILSKLEPSIEIVATNVEIPVRYPVNPTIGLEEESCDTNINLLTAEPPRVEPQRIEPPRVE